LKAVTKKGLVYLLFLTAGISTLLIGMVCPFYFRGISPALVHKAGESSTQIQALANELTNYGRISPVFQFNYTVDSLSLDDRLIQLAKENPTYYFTGGAAPYVEEIIRRLDLNEKDYSSPTTVVELFTPAKHRAYISDFLSRSRNANVLDILKTRDIKGTILFSPVDSPSGTPLDIAILTTALLIQAEETPRPLAAELAGITRNAMTGDPVALETIENIYLSILTFGKRFQWVSLCELMRNLPSTDSMQKMSALFREYPDDKSLLFTVLLVNKNPVQLFEFTERYGKEAIKDLRESIPYGEGAVALLINRMSPIYRPHAWNKWLDRLQHLILSTPIYRIAISNPGLTGVIKLFFLFSAGLSFIILLRLIVHQANSDYRGWVASFLANIGNITIAAAFSVSAWLVLEPEFLKQPHATPPPLTIHFATANPFENLKSDAMNNMQIDQVTLLILGLFFILQIAIYAYARVRLQEIKKVDLSPEIKLRLIDNEENLFDSGLYVGLGGTVASLIMLAMHIVEASLMAAYASTLFGILFVAILKIFNVRPYRYDLIMQIKVPVTPPRQSILKLK
jgi:hypothetical protein